jgi:hypothetical protein
MVFFIDWNLKRPDSDNLLWGAGAPTLAPFAETETGVGWIFDDLAGRSRKNESFWPCFSGIGTPGADRVRTKALKKQFYPSNLFPLYGI